MVTAVIATAILLTGGDVGVGSIPNGGPRLAFSGNGKYKVGATARVAEGKIKSRMQLYAKEGDQYRQLWTVEFPDNTHPAEVYVNNHGCVVTVGNTLRGLGDGEPALAIYRDGKVFRKYSRDDLVNKCGEPETARFATGTRVVSIPPSWHRYSYACFDPEDRFCIWDDATRAWVVVDLTDGSLDKADQKSNRYYVEQARKDACTKIEEKNGEYCYPYYYRLARFLRAEDKAVFEKLLTEPYSKQLGTGYSSGPGDIFFFASNQYREIAEWALAAIEDGKQDAIEDSHRFDRHEGYRHLGSLTLLATFQEAPTSDDGIVMVWLAPIGTADAAGSDRPEHALGIDLRFKIRKPLVMPVKIHLYGITPGTYRVRGYWNKDIERVYTIKDDFWKQTGQFTIEDIPEVEIEKGESVDVAVSFRSTN